MARTRKRVCLIWVVWVWLKGDVKWARGFGYSLPWSWSWFCSSWSWFCEDGKEEEEVVGRRVYSCEVSGIVGLERKSVAVPISLRNTITISLESEVVKSRVGGPGRACRVGLGQVGWVLAVCG